MRRYYAITLAFPRRALRRGYSSSTQHFTPESEFEANIFAVHQQEKLALYRLRIHADYFIREAEQIMGPARSVTDPETILKSNTQDFICTERYNVAAKQLEIGKSIIAHAREIQEHCKDLEQAPLPTYKTDISQPGPHDFVALKLEEKVRTNEIITRLQQLRNRAKILNKTLDLATRGRKDEADAYIKQFEGQGLLEMEPESKPPGKGATSNEPTAAYSPTRPEESKKAKDKDTKTASPAKSGSPAKAKSSSKAASSAKPEKSAKVDTSPEQPEILGNWDDLNAEIEKQLEKDEAAAAKTPKGKR